jgi:hypothetical protein
MIYEGITRSSSLKSVDPLGNLRGREVAQNQRKNAAGRDVKTNSPPKMRGTDSANSKIDAPALNIVIDSPKDEACCSLESIVQRVTLACLKEPKWVWRGWDSNP